MIKGLKNMVLYSFSALITWVVIDVIFQQSKIISGLHVQVNKKGTYFRSQFHAYFFNEGVGIQYTDSNGIMTFLPGQSKTWNLYGDSYIEALQVFQRHHFANTLAKNKEVTIQNFGQSSMNFESMYARYFQVKDKHRAEKHLFFISSDDFDTDDIGDFLALPTFTDSDLILENTSFNYQQTLKRQVERNLQNSSTLMLAKSDLRQIKNGQTQTILFDKLITKPNLENHSQDLVKPKRVVQLLKRLNQEPNVVFIYRGKIPLSSTYFNYFKSAGIQLVNLQKAMDESEQNKSFYYHKVTKTYGHWNREAHQFIATFLEHEL